MLKALKRYIHHFNGCFIVVLSMTVMLFGILYLNSIGFHIPFVQELIGLLFIFIFPGYLIFRHLKIEVSSDAEKLILIIGLSISFLIFLGYSINAIYPSIGILNPLIDKYILLTESMILLLLALTIRKSDFSINLLIKNYREMTILLGLLLILIISILGSFLMNSYGLNAVNIILIVCITLVMYLIGSGSIPTRLHPISIFSISLALLLDSSLISRYIWGWDIQGEYYLSNLVISQGYWNSNIALDLNSNLSVTIFPSIIHAITSIKLVYIFKVIYPSIFSLVPVGVYLIVKKQTDDAIAALSALFLMSFFIFFTEMLQLIRQQLAELFLILVVLLIIANNRQPIQKSVMLIIFSLSMIVSYYGIAFIYTFLIFLLYIIDYILKNTPKRSVPMESTYSEKISPFFVLLFIVFTFLWYTSNSNSSVFLDVVGLLRLMFNSLLNDFLNAQSTQGLYILTYQGTSIVYTLEKYLNIIVNILILIGILFTIFSRKYSFNPTYLYLSIMNLVICFCAIILPYFGNSINTTRLVHISHLLLAPFFVVGGLMVITNLIILYTRNPEKIIQKTPLKILTYFIIIYFLFNSKIFYEAIGEDARSITLNNEIEYPIFNDKEIAGAKWLNIQKEFNNIIYSNGYTWLAVLCYNYLETAMLPLEHNLIKEGSYICLDVLKYYKDRNLITYGPTGKSFLKYDELTANRNKIYDNHEINIFK